MSAPKKKFKETHSLQLPVLWKPCAIHSFLASSTFRFTDLCSCYQNTLLSLNKSVILLDIIQSIQPRAPLFGHVVTVIIHFLQHADNQTCYSNNVQHQSSKKQPQIHHRFILVYLQHSITDAHIFARTEVPLS